MEYMVWVYKNLIKYIFMLGILIGYSAKSITAQDNSKPPKHFIRPTLYFNFVRFPAKGTKSKLVDLYGFRQANIGFFAPLYTNTWYKPDSITLSSFHVLTQASMSNSRIELGASSNIENKILRLQAGITAIYASGNKNIWYFSFQPFVSQDRAYFSKPTTRVASVFLFNRTVSPSLSYKLGFVRTFIFGDNVRNNLPLIGFRFGRLDRTHLNLLLIRNISVNIPVGNNTWLEIFSKPIGGLHVIGNRDSIWGDNKRVNFGRLEILTGIGFTYRSASSFVLFANAGIAHNKRAVIINENDKKEVFKTKPSLFINAGISISLGSGRRIQNNYQMYDLIGLQNQITGQNLNGSNNSNIPADTKGNDFNKSSRIRLNDVKDFLTEEL